MDKLNPVVFENEFAVQYADGTMIHKACGQPMTFDGPFMGRHNQYTCYTVGCSTHTIMGSLVAVGNDHRDRKIKWAAETLEQREREADAALKISGLTAEAVERIMSKNRMG